MIEAKREILNPPGWPLLLVGGFLGLVAGAFSFSESPDKATAVGIALFVGISIGGWLGAVIVRAVSAILCKFYKDSDAKLVKARDDLKQYFADTLPLLSSSIEVRALEGESSKRAMAKFSSSVEVFRALGNVFNYLYPIVAIITFSEITTRVLLSAGGLEVPPALSLLAYVSLSCFMFLFVVNILIVFSGLLLIRNSVKLMGEINSIEQLLAARIDGDIEKLIPDTSSVEKAVSVPPMVLSRLAA